MSFQDRSRVKHYRQMYFDMTGPAGVVKGLLWFGKLMVDRDRKLEQENRILTNKLDSTQRAHTVLIQNARRERNVWKQRYDELLEEVSRRGV